MIANTAVSLQPIDITRLLVSSFEKLFPAFNTAKPNVLFWGVSAISLLFSWMSGDWLGLSKTFHFFALINSLTELAGCFGSLSCWNMKHFLMSQVTFSWTLVAKMFLYSSAFILLSPSFIKSSIKLSEAVLDRQSCMPMPWHHLHHALQVRLYA